MVVDVRRCMGLGGVGVRAKPGLKALAVCGARVARLGGVRRRGRGSKQAARKVADMLDVSPVRAAAGGPV